MADELDARIPAGMQIFFLKDIDKRPKVNTFFTNLAAELVTRGRTASRINASSNFDTRGVLIVFDYRVIEINYLQKFQDTQAIRYLITFNPEEEIEDFEKIREAEINDPQGSFTVQIWKRIKRRII